MFAEVWGLQAVLRRWKENPLASKRQIGVRYDWVQDTEHNRQPLSITEVARLKLLLLKRWSPATYRQRFPRESRHKRHYQPLSSSSGS
jgi:hypothetical protein